MSVPSSTLQIGHWERELKSLKAHLKHFAPNCSQRGSSPRDPGDQLMLRGTRRKLMVEKLQVRRATGQLKEEEPRSRATMNNPKVQ
ncbi:hypothetical protein LINPERHAP1_LOCUS20265 [Linum perenne]